MDKSPVQKRGLLQPLPLRLRMLRRHGARLNDICLFQRDPYGAYSVMACAWRRTCPLRQAMLYVFPLSPLLHTSIDLVIIHGYRNVVGYQQEMVFPIVIPHKRPEERGMAFVEGQSACSQAHATQVLLQQLNIRRLPFPPKSLDLNVIDEILGRTGQAVTEKTTDPTHSS
ncbi:hypothetical protein DPMN_117055 [Dreissena polymorpha]|uniref:Uncharacterized protein n=1 Tax=Dreissena polymorpha TaxID=45954 RepID=A0A9D4KPT0_DREPO|nr:hypothetical protein DPMN_117055 [Dreissena polymorpha]